jgi:replication factor C large subunit
MDVWAIKHKPTKISDIVGQKKGLDLFRLWYRTWKPGKKPALIYGPPGSGKTALVEALANEKKLEIIELNASDYRTAAQIKEVIGKSLTQASLFKRGKIFLIDEIDGVSGRNDRGGIPEIIRLIEESKHPIVLTCNDVWNPKLSKLRSASQLIQFRKVDYWSLVKRLNEIVENEYLDVSGEIVKNIAKRSNGDLRSAINDLQTFSQKINPKLVDLESLGERETEANIFDVMKIIFKTNSAKSARLSIDGLAKKPDEIIWWIEENIVNEYEKPEEIAGAYEMLAKANMFMARIYRRQNWKLLKYGIDLMTAGVAVSKDQMYKKFSRYQYPSKIKYLGMTKAKRAKEKAELSQLSKDLHCSVRKIRKEYLPFFKAEELKNLS